MLTQMKRLPGLQDVNSDQQNGGLDEADDTMTASPPPNSASPASRWTRRLYGAFGQSEVSIIYTQLNQYYVVLEVAPQYWQSPEGLKDIYLHTAGGTATFRCSAVANGQANTTPLAVNHTGLFPSVTLSFNLAPDVSLSDATSASAQMQQRLARRPRSKASLPARCWPTSSHSAPSRC